MAQSMPRQRVRSGSGPAARWLLLGGVAAVVLVLTFALGMLVGQKRARQADPPAQAAAEPAKKATPSAQPRRGGLVEPVAQRPPQERLTFYHTLTAPLGTVPAASKVDLGARGEAARPRPAADRLPIAPAPAATARADKPASDRSPAARAGDSRAGEWAVQVGAFRDRGQAESVRKPLATAGLDAYLIATTAPDGQTSYKVRLGSFRTREEAARLAARVRQERSLTAFVTPR